MKWHFYNNSYTVHREQYTYCKNSRMSLFIVVVSNLKMDKIASEG